MFALSLWNSLTMEVRIADSLTCSISELKERIFRLLIWMYTSYMILIGFFSLFTEIGASVSILELELVLT